MEHIFHPLVWRWFTERFGDPTPAQRQGWEAIAKGKSTLIAAPTGSGKTLAAFLWSIDRLIKRALDGALDERTSVVYVSPLKALGNDIAKKLDARLSRWAPETAKELKRLVAEIIELADNDALDLVRSREVEQQVLDIIDGRQAG